MNRFWYLHVLDVYSYGTDENHFSIPNYFRENMGEWFIQGLDYATYQFEMIKGIKIMWRIEVYSLPIN